LPGAAQPRTPSTAHQLCRVTSTASPGAWWDEGGKLTWELQTANRSHRHEPSALQGQSIQGRSPCRTPEP